MTRRVKKMKKILKNDKRKWPEDALLSISVWFYLLFLSLIFFFFFFLFFFFFCLWSTRINLYHVLGLGGRVAHVVPYMVLVRAGRASIMIRRA